MIVVTTYDELMGAANSKQPHQHSQASQILFLPVEEGAMRTVHQMHCTRAFSHARTYRVSKVTAQLQTETLVSVSASTTV
jgi:hypothetical protein